jgi:two-component system, OmpR family, sensor histidine kinase TctE
MLLPSLRLALLGWLLVPMGFLVAVNLFMTREQARDAATVEQDRLLLGSARIIGQQTHFEDELLQVVIPPAALELFRGSGLRDRVYYRVANASGTLLAGHTDLPAPPNLYLKRPNGLIRQSAIKKYVSLHTLSRYWAPACRDQSLLRWRKPRTR